MTLLNFPVYTEITGPIVMLGFGSIGRGTLPLIARHFKFDKSRMVVIDPREDASNTEILNKFGVRQIKEYVTKENYTSPLKPLLTQGEGQGFCVNLSVDTGSLDLMKLCRRLEVLYIDTVIEPWLGFYFDKNMNNADRTNYALREPLRKEKGKKPPAVQRLFLLVALTQAWYLGWSSAVVNLANDIGLRFDEPHHTDREGWAKLMQKLGVKGIHIAERDTQRTKNPKPLDVFWNTWSVEGMISEGLQPSELGWGTHEKWMPDNAKEQKEGCKSAIYLEQPGAITRVRTWCPTPGPQYGFLITHNESVSIPDFFTVRDSEGAVVYRPTCHYAYHPPNDAVLSLHEMFGNGGKPQPVLHVLEEDEIEDGIDELGVLLYGHEKNAYWFGSRLSIEETRRIAPYQNATGLQVTSAVLSGMVWALENPKAGIVEADEIDYKRCLQVQLPYLGPVEGHYTNWTPLEGRPGLFPEDIDEDDPWQFKNVLVR